MQFIQSNHGKHPQLVHENQIYWFNKTLKSQKVFYQCQNKKNGCPGKITISPGKTTVTKKVAHECMGVTHEAIKVLSSKQELKEKLKDPAFSNVNPSTLYVQMETTLAKGNNLL